MNSSCSFFLFRRTYKQQCSSCRSFAPWPHPSRSGGDACWIAHGRRRWHGRPSGQHQHRPLLGTEAQDVLPKSLFSSSSLAWRQHRGMATTADSSTLTKDKEEGKDTSKKDQDKYKDIRNAVTRRKKSSSSSGKRQRQSVHKVEERERQTQHLSNLRPIYQPEDFEQFFDSTMPQFTPAQVMECTEQLDKLMLRESSSDDGDADEKPLAVILMSKFKKCKPALRKVLGFILSLSKEDKPDPKKPALEHVVEVLIQARILSIYDDDFAWSEDHAVAERRKASDPDHPTQAVLCRNARLASDHSQDATNLALHLIHTFSTQKALSIVKLLEDYIGSRENVEEDRQESEQKPARGTNWKKGQLRRRLQVKTRTHFHLVADKIANFFFIPKEFVRCDHFEASREKWNESREEFLTTVINVQEKIQAEKEWEETYRSSSSSSIAKVASKRKRRNEVLKVHLIFDAMPLQQISDTNERASNDSLLTTAPSTTTMTAAVTEQTNPNTRNMVFIDNLPIDIADTRVEELYSRCGQLKSVQIFNRRPDLDPGPLSEVERKKRIKKRVQLLKSTRLQEKKGWQRSCTPVYALLSFADEDGYKGAIDHSLRLFGMIVQRHPVRSIPSSDMTSLFVENIPGECPCSDYEYKLGKILGPDLYVCLDAGQDNRAVVGSCEIKFPTFEYAYESFLKLQKQLQYDEENDDRNKNAGQLEINWIRTRSDADLWWSRQLGFD